MEKYGLLFEEEIYTDDNSVKPLRNYTEIELFAGAGGLALGMEKAGLNCVALNEFDKYACATLRKNRPDWNVIEGDVHNISFKEYEGKVDVVTGGFPCQAFSYAGKKLGFNDARGTLFFEFARVVNEVKPLICIGENVKGLLNHDNGRTLEGMISVLDEIGYRVLPVQLLKAINYKVPQKRERLVIVGIRKDINIDFQYPKPYKRIYTLKDALKKGDLYDCDCPEAPYSKYSEKKLKVFKLVPPGGYWRDIPEPVAKEYMKSCWDMEGGRTGILRRMSLDEPSLTVLTSPSQKQTERCHPLEARPFTVRENARCQSFPDEWEFCGTVGEQYKQVGNAVPVNLSYEIAMKIREALAGGEE